MSPSEPAAPDIDPVDDPARRPGRAAGRSLAPQYAAAAQAVAQVLGGESFEGARSACFAALPDAASRAGARNFAFATLRAYGIAPALVEQLLHRPITDPVLLALLHVALTDLRANPAHAHTLVDQAVHAAVSLGRQAARGLVNAVLRNYLRQREALESAIRERPSARHRHPDWWIRRVRSAWPAQWQTVLEVADQPPPLVVRVNLARGSLEAFGQALQGAGLTGTVIGPVAVRVEPAVPVDQLPGFAQGWCSVQDAGAQRAAALLGAGPGHRVLDACAAPGGKTTHLLELGAGSVVALEKDAARAKRITENLDRTGHRAQVLVGDATQPASWWDGRPFDRILADVPCSASGVVRRHPDIKWLRRAADPARFAREQAAILRALWSLLAPGGRLLYVTCSIFPEENARQIEAFLAARPEAVRLPLEGLAEDLAAGDARGQLLPCADHDGFFYALLGKPAP
jgi:16S rRNA (cytosine967-C5)-methyltransferase